MKIIEIFKKKKKEYEELKLSEAQRIVAIEEIRDTQGFKVIMDDLRKTSENIRDIGVLSADYGNLRINEQIGTLGGGGLIASHALNILIEKYEKEEKPNSTI